MTTATETHAARIEAHKVTIAAEALVKQLDAEAAATFTLDVFGKPTPEIAATPEWKAMAKAMKVAAKAAGTARRIQREAEKAHCAALDAESDGQDEACDAITGRTVRAAAAQDDGAHGEDEGC